MDIFILVKQNHHKNDDEANARTVNAINGKRLCLHGFSEKVQMNSTFIKSHATEIININFPSHNPRLHIRRAGKVILQK